MGWKPFRSLQKSLKKGAKKLKGQLKKHGPNILKGIAGIGLASFAFPGLGGLLGKAMGGAAGNAQLGGILSKGLGSIGQGGLKGLLGHATSAWNQGGGFMGLLKSQGGKYAERQLQNAFRGPQMGPMPQGGGFNMASLPPGMLGLGMQNPYPQQGQPQVMAQNQVQPQIPYQQQGIENYMGSNAWTGV